jgi:membrane protein
MVLIIACLLLLSFAISAILEISVGFLKEFLPGLAYFWQVINTLLSFSIISFSFTLIYQILPDVRVRWRDAGVGAAITTILFMFGQYLLGEFLEEADLGSAYGVAGSFVIIIAWVYCSAHIFLFGAEFTQVYARRHGSPIVPAAHAVRAYRAPKELLAQEEEDSTEDRERDRNSKSLTNFLAKLGKNSIRVVQSLLKQL